MANVSIIAAFLAGIVSFLSPCILPLVPAFLAYLTGITDPKEKGIRLKLFLNSLAYVLGFTLVFASLGVLLNTVLESVSYDFQIWLARIGGTIIIFFGLYLSGVFKLKFLEKERKLKVKQFKFSYLTSFLFGAAFAAGWTPCVGAVLASILALSITQPGLSFLLLLAYSLGLGLPFLIVGLFSEKATIWINKLGPKLKYFNLVVGIVLIILGVLVFTQTLSIFANLEWIGSVLE